MSDHELDVRTDYTRAIERNRRKCVLEEQGTRDNARDWVAAGAVPAAVGNQGECSACWVWNAVEASSAEFRLHNRGVERLSVQDVLNSTFPNQPGCRGGPVAVALQHMLAQGACLESECPYTGIKDLGPQTHRDRHRIDRWRTVEDSDDTVREACDSRPVVISIPYVSGLLSYKGGYLDLFKAEQHHDPSLHRVFSLPDTPKYHTVLLVGYGYFTPDARPHERLGYWIIKNQWGENWGVHGYAFILWNSSSVTVADRTRPARRLTDRQQLERQVGISPAIAILNPPNFANQNQNAPPNIVQEMQNLQELEALITDTANWRRTLIILFYDPVECVAVHPRINEDFDDIGVAYETEGDAFILAKIDMRAHLDVYQTFEIDPNDPVALFVYKPKRRTSLHGRRFVERYDGPYIYDYMMEWVGINEGRNEYGA